MFSRCEKFYFSTIWIWTNSFWIWLWYFKKLQKTKWTRRESNPDPILVWCLRKGGWLSRNMVPYTCKGRILTIRLRAPNESHKFILAFGARTEPRMFFESNLLISLFFCVFKFVYLFIFQNKTKMSVVCKHSSVKNKKFVSKFQQFWIKSFDLSVKYF